MVIGSYPTRVERIDDSLFVKRDDRTHAVYGGNKVRKLERILEEAKRRVASRVLTFGAAGSHHVLATAVHGSRAGLRVAAVLVPQPRGEHAEANLRAALACGLEPLVCSSTLGAPLIFAAGLRRGDFVVPPGGSNVLGTLGYLDAVAELAAQIQGGELPPPDAIVVALGTGGTAAGLLAGVVQHGLATRIVAVKIAGAAVAAKVRTVELAYRAARRAGHALGRRDLSARLEVNGRWLGAGYGHPTPEGDAATVQAASLGMRLDPTYTAKAFAAALALAHGTGARRILYWHTLSAERPAGGSDLPPELGRLFR